MRQLQEAVDGQLPEDGQEDDHNSPHFGYNPNQIQIQIREEFESNIDDRAADSFGAVKVPNLDSGYDHQ